MARTAVIARQSPTRCPFCHDAVNLSEPWVVCRGCLARHHSECWALNVACSSCGAPECLKDASRPKVCVEPGAQSDERATQTLHDLDARFSLWAPARSALRYTGSALTLGLVPVLWAEASLVDHVRLESRGLKRSATERPALEETRRLAQDRARFGAGVFTVCLLVGLVAAAVLNDGDYRNDPQASLALVAACTTWVLTLLGLLIGHHRALRRHDAAQLAHRARDLHPRRQASLANLHEDAWTRTAARLGRGTAFAMGLSTLCFPFAYLIFPLWLARAFQVPLEVHERRLKLGDLGA